MRQNKQDMPFDGGAFQERYHYDGPLGAVYDPKETRFYLWAPTAQQVVLRLYQDGTEGSCLIAHQMRLGEKGVWQMSVRGDLHGIYYDYLVTAEGETRPTADPYAKAAGCNGLRSMAADLSRTDPEGWEQDAPPAKGAEDVIYEIHVKDFSWDPAFGGAEELRGSYAALTQEDTSLHQDGIHPTGLAYLRRLGVTHVQLLPCYDFGSVDEAGDGSQFNWGYDPVNYNLPEGSYSSDPHRGEVRIRELKELIQSLHKNGFRVIMDVVYNHTYRPDSCLERTVPGYYYRQDREGRLSNGSGCGNEIASERSMCARYIHDSVLYWAEEYHMDGFRFDLMGVLDAPLMVRIRESLDRRFGAGEKLLYGEPWAAGGVSPRPGTVMADRHALPQLAPGIGAFCDATRDSVKGSVMDPASTGFVNGGQINAKWLECCLKGWALENDRFPVRSPMQTITYLSSHDDWTLWDKLVYTLDPKRDFMTLSPKILQINRLAAAICMSCQGHLFLLSGEEFGRTKLGIRDSYCSPLSVNRLDWERAWENQELVDYYRGLIALRFQLPGLTDKSERAGERILWCRETAPGCMMAMVDNGPEARWSKVCLMFNTNPKACQVTLPQGDWELLVNGENSFLWQEPARLTGEITVAGKEALFVGQVGSKQ